MSQTPAGTPQVGRGLARRVLVVGGSAGALSPLKKLIERLQPGLETAALVTLHVAATRANLLPAILSRRGVLRAYEPRDGDPLHADYVYIARPDRHLEIGEDSVRVRREPKVNGHRPSIDVLFESAAREFGPATVAVLLSGTLDDGSHGLLAVRRAGGVAIVQDPGDAEFPELPKAAIRRAGPVQVLTGDALADALADIIDRLPPRSDGADEAPPVVSGEERNVSKPLGASDEAGNTVGVTCPECGGSLWLTGEPDDPVLSCRIGHRMTLAALEGLQDESLERSLWAGLRALEEHAAAAKFLEEMHERRQDLEGAARHRARRKGAEADVAKLRSFLTAREGE